VSLSSPRFRSDLDAHRGELEGIAYYDVTDRATGSTFRMYEVEYLVARELDGRALDAVATGVVERLGVQTSAEELAQYAAKLGELGFLEQSELAGDVHDALSSAVLAPPGASASPTGAAAPNGPASEPAREPSDFSNMFKLMEGAAPAAPPAPTQPSRAEPDQKRPSFDEEPTLTAPPKIHSTIEAEFAADARTPVIEGQELEDLLVRTSPPPTPLDALRRPAADSSVYDRETVPGLPAMALEPSGPAAAAVVPALPPEAEPLPPRKVPDDTARVKPTAKKRRGTSPAWLAVPIVLVVALLAAVYWPAQTAAPAARVRVEPVRLETVVRLYPGAAQLYSVPPLKFSFAEPGTVAELLPPGQRVKPGDALAKLDGYVKLEKQLAELRSREAYYQNELDKAERTGNGPAFAHAKAKVEEKRTLIAGLQARYAKYVLSSTTPGLVSENMVKVGDAVTPGQPVTSVLQVRMRADFTMPPADAAALKAGMIARLQRADGKLVDCRVERVAEEGEGVAVRVEVLDVSGGLQARDTVRLVRSRYENIFRLPVQAVFRPGGGGDRVYVVQDGRARQRVVTVLDRDAREVLIGQGIAAGDRVVTSGAVALKDGATVQEE